MEQGRVLVDSCKPHLADPVLGAELALALARLDADLQVSLHVRHQGGLIVGLGQLVFLAFSPYSA